MSQGKCYHNLVRGDMFLAQYIWPLIYSLVFYKFFSPEAGKDRSLSGVLLQSGINKSLKNSTLNVCKIKNYVYIKTGSREWNDQYIWRVLQIYKLIYGGLYISIVTSKNVREGKKVLIETIQKTVDWSPRRREERK